MEKIYGYKEKDIVGLAEFLKERGTQSLTSVFASYGEKYGKAKGTVRNLYYAVAKRSVEDDEFCQKYLGGTPLSVGKIVEFNDCEERQLIKKIILAKSFGKSIRGAIMELSGGDAKIALRFQNKYRNAVKNKPRLIEEIVAELKSSGVEATNPVAKSDLELISEDNFNRLKCEINNLVAKIALKEKSENQFLKDRIAFLERENLRLSSALYGKKEGNLPIKFFRSGGEQNILN